jgi:hypothetical protein
MALADAEYAGKRKQSRKEMFLIEMDREVLWKGLFTLNERLHPKECSSIDPNTGSEISSRAYSGG